MSQFLNSKSLCLSVFVSQNEPKICRHQLPVTHHMPPAFGRQSHAWQQHRLSAELQPQGKELQQEGGFGGRQDCAGRICSQAGRRTVLLGEPLTGAWSTRVFEATGGCAAWRWAAPHSTQRVFDRPWAS